MRFFPRNLYLIFLLLCSFKIVQAQTYIFAQLNGTPLNTTGWTLQGDAHVGNLTNGGNSELIICRSILNLSGAVFYNQPINLSKCNKWKAEFDFRMYDGTGADGLAFCFLDTPPVGFVTGSGLGIPAAANGLKVCFDTWNNCNPFDANTVHVDMPKIEIRWGVGYNSGTGANEISGECLVSMPTLDNSNGALSFIRSSNYNHALISYDSGNIQVYVNNKLYLSGYQQFNFTGYLGFTASTGGYTDNHSIKNVIIYTEMPPSYAGNAVSFCPHDTIQIGGPSNPDYQYSWYPTEGIVNPTVSNPYLSLGNDSSSYQLHKYYVKTSFQNKDGCASVDSVIVKVNAAPLVNFIPPKICLSDAIGQFYDSSYTSDPSSLPFQYQWNFGDPNAGPGNPNISFLQNPAHHYSAALKYSVGLKVINSLGCADSTIKTFTVNGSFPKASFSVNLASEPCSNQIVPIVNLSTVDFGSLVDLRIYWGDSASIFYNDSMPYDAKVYSHLYPNPITSSPATYTIRMIASSGITCVNETDQQITLLPSPHVQFDKIPAVCSNAEPLLITEASELTGLGGSFSFSGDGITAEGLLSPGLVSPGYENLLYRFAASNGCVDSASQVVHIQAPPATFAGNDTSIVIGQPLQLLATVDDPTITDFSWSPPAGLNNPVIPNPIALPVNVNDTIRYTVMATDSVGCIGKASLLVRLFKTLPDIFVPNAFTPGAAENNIFRPIPVGISSLSYFRIYNRWGQLVFSSSRMGDGWDGTLSGIPQSTGSYVWMVQGTSFAGKIISHRGTMTLIR